MDELYNYLIENNWQLRGGGAYTFSMKFKRYWVVTLDQKNNLAKREGFNGQHRIVICGEFLKLEVVLTQLKEFMDRLGY